MGTQRFAVHILLFNCQRTILAALNNCGPYVEKIYCAYSELPWSHYNPDAQADFKNTFDLSLLKRSAFYHKIVLIEGVWEKDEDQRNACRERAIKDGMDYLIIQDADELYLRKDFEKNLLGIDENPDFDFYTTPWCTYWKNLEYNILNEKGSHVVGYPEFAINLSKRLPFIRARAIKSSYKYELSGLCHHLSYVLSDQEVWSKINTWSHSHEFDTDDWYQAKWENWQPNSTDLHPINPSAWKQAAKIKLSRPIDFNWINKGGLSQLPEKENRTDKPSLATRAYRKGLRLLNEIRIDRKRKLFNQILEHQGRRIHMGCGDEKLYGYINIDARATLATDFVEDLNSLDAFSDASVEAIYSHAFFEHLYADSRIPHLKRAYNALDKNGVLLYIGIPYFPEIAKLYMEKGPGITADIYLLADVYRYTHGNPEGAVGWWIHQLHKSLFDADECRKILMASGFKNFKIFNYCYPGEEGRAVTCGFYALKDDDKEISKRGVIEFILSVAHHKIMEETVNFIE